MLKLASRLETNHTAPAEHPREENQAGGGGGGAAAHLHFLSLEPIVQDGRVAVAFG